MAKANAISVRGNNIYAKENLTLYIDDKEFGSSLSTSIPSDGTLIPNVVYNINPLEGNVTINLSSDSTDKASIYELIFTTSSTAPTITWDSSIEWVGGEAPAVDTNKKYEISILEGIGKFEEVG